MIDKGQHKDFGSHDKKKPYKAPVLLEYGSVAKLTEGGQGSYIDSMIMRKKQKKIK